MFKVMTMCLLCASLIVSFTISHDAYGLRLFPTIPADEIIATEYSKSDTVFVNPFSESAATALCENGDAITAGGYSIGFSSPGTLENVYIYADKPVHLETDTSSQEGWQAGVANDQNETVSITASVLCTDITS
jgi:hypothetical protein